MDLTAEVWFWHSELRLKIQIIVKHRFLYLALSYSVLYS